MTLLIKNKIETLYKEYLVLEDLVETKTKESKNIEGLTNLEEIQKIVTDRYVDLYLFSKDSQIVFSDLICFIEFFKEHSPSESLPENIEDFFRKKREWKPKRLSVPLADRAEIPEDLLIKEREKFLKSPLYNNIKKQVESSLD